MSHHKIEYEDLMHRHGLRVTPQRLTILDAVCDVGGHATLGAIYRTAKLADPAISRSTIYRTLEVFCEIGLVTSAEIGEDGKVYEIVEAHPHHHLVCQVCGEIQQIPDEIMQPTFDRIKQAFGFDVETSHLVLSGTCRNCRGSISCE
ncbi:MAG: transcriptional repressor [Anaerolineae bacterium]|nr:transcriptional repressor [Anaerolineae bacterium]